MIPLAALHERQFRRSQTATTAKLTTSQAQADVFALILPAAVPLKAIGWNNSAAMRRFESMSIPGFETD